MTSDNRQIRLNGIHHVTAISGDAQRTIDFYVETLGLHFVKRTVNFDDPYTYHLYFGDDAGSPGTVLTFFPWGDASKPGREGSDQIAAFSFSYPAEAFDFWLERLRRLGVGHDVRESDLDGRVLSLRDPDGFRIDLVGTAGDLRPGSAGLPPAAALRGFHSITLTERNAGATADHLVHDLGFSRIGTKRSRTRYAAGPAGSGCLVDVVAEPTRPPGSMGRGIIHHVAFRTQDDVSQAAVRDILLARGVRVTPVRDRQYFKSIYFQEPGGVLFEIATDTPGFAVDEPIGSLGSTLKLPPWLEKDRRIIEHALPLIVVPDRTASAGDRVPATADSRR